MLDSGFSTSKSLPTLEPQRFRLLCVKLGPMLLQFPKFDKWVLKGSDEFRVRLQSFFKRAAEMKAGKFAVEIRNKDWLDARLVDLLRENNVGLALTDTSFMPRPWEKKGALDLVTADFTYVCWLGNRNAIEEQTTTWDKPVIDRQNDLRSWVVVLRRLVLDKRIRKIFAFCEQSLRRARTGHRQTLHRFVERKELD